MMNDNILQSLELDSESPAFEALALTHRLRFLYLTWHKRQMHRPLEPYAFALQPPDSLKILDGHRLHVLDAAPVDNTVF